MSTALTTTTEPKTLKALVASDAFKQQVAMALPRHLSSDRFTRIALTAMQRTPKLAECDQNSFFRCLLDLSQMGLEPDGRRAHLIPFRNNKKGITECQLIVDYKGLVELAMRSNMLSNIHADVVCENDVFEYDMGRIVSHKVDFRQTRGKMYAAYAIASFKDGTQKSEVLSRDDVESVRKRSRSGNDGPWITDYNEMAKKTAFRRLSKWLPLSAEFRDAVERDDEYSGVIDAPATPVHRDTSSLDALSASLPAPPDPDADYQSDTPPHYDDYPPEVEAEIMPPDTHDDTAVESLDALLARLPKGRRTAILGQAKAEGWSPDRLASAVEAALKGSAK